MAFKVAVRKNSTGEIRFTERDYDLGIEDLDGIDGQTYYWTEGNMGCDCNLSIVFDEEIIDCSFGLYTNMYIENEDGRRIDLQPNDELPTNYAKCPQCNKFLHRPMQSNFFCEHCLEPWWDKDIVFAF